MKDSADLICRNLLPYALKKQNSVKKFNSKNCLCRIYTKFAFHIFGMFLFTFFILSPITSSYLIFGENIFPTQNSWWGLTLIYLLSLVTSVVAIGLIIIIMRKLTTFEQQMDLRPTHCLVKALYFLVAFVAGTSIGGSYGFSIVFCVGGPIVLFKTQYFIAQGLQAVGAVIITYKLFRSKLSETLREWKKRRVLELMY